MAPMLSAVLTVKTAVWDNGFASRIAELTDAGMVSVIEQTDPYVSMPGEAGTVPSVAVVLRVIG